MKYPYSVFALNGNPALGTVSTLGRYRLLATALLLAVAGCATVAPAPLAHSRAAASNLTPGITSISGDELRQTGRTNTADALRASSPIFH